MKIIKNIKLAQDVEGFLTDREGRMLYSMARASPEGAVIVEIGSWKGKSTIWLAQGLKDSGRTGKIFAIDPHTGSPEHQQENTRVWTFEQFKKNIQAAGLDSMITPVVATSEAAASQIPQGIHLLFIDGAHELEAVRLDYRIYAPKVAEGGIIAFHDTPWPGVKQITEQVFTQDGFKNIYFADTLMAGYKTGKPSGKDRFKNRCMLRLNCSFQKACASDQPKFFRKIWKNTVKLLQAVINTL